MAMTARKTGPQTTQVTQADTRSAEVSRNFEVTFLEQWPQVYGFLLRLVGDHAEAEDLALETFMRLYQRPPVDDQPLNLGGWLHRVATNLGLNAIRSWKRRQRYELENGKGVLQEHPGSNPAELFTAEEEHRLVRQILAEMNPRQSQLLILRHSGMAYKEIAATLGLSATSLGPLLLRAETEFERRYRLANPEEEI
jgi:RNA polymerase sigma-70 factor (ECF subfamily)